MEAAQQLQGRGLVVRDELEMGIVQQAAVLRELMDQRQAARLHGMFSSQHEFGKPGVVVQLHARGRLLLGFIESVLGRKLAF